MNFELTCRGLQMFVNEYFVYIVGFGLKNNQKILEGNKAVV